LAPFGKDVKQTFIAYHEGMEVQGTIQHFVCH